MSDNIKVLIVDNNSLVRTGLANVLAAESDISVVGAVRGGAEAINKALELKPDVIIMDIPIPHYGGLEAMVLIREKYAGAKVLILTVSDTDDNLFQALKFGAQGYLLKSANITEVVEAVRRTAAGETTLSPAFAVQLIAELRDRQKIEKGISAIERDVLQSLGKGFTNKDIASQLYISEDTVKACLRGLLDKVHRENRAEAVAYAAHPRLRNVRQGVISSAASM